jgi:hypothetical protein
MPGDVGLVAELLSKVFGWIVDPTGYEQLTLDNKLRIMMRGINEAMAKCDWATVDALFAEYRELRTHLSA